MVSAAKGADHDDPIESTSHAKKKTSKWSMITLPQNYLIFVWVVAQIKPVILGMWWVNSSVSVML